MLLLAPSAIASTPVRPAPVGGDLAREHGRDASTSSAQTERGQAPRLEPKIAVDAERTFAADAQAIGQRAAIRKWAAADAVLFTPQPINARGWLKDRAEPAGAVEWWPTASWMFAQGGSAGRTLNWYWLVQPDGARTFVAAVWNGRMLENVVNNRTAAPVG